MYCASKFYISYKRLQATDVFNMTSCFTWKHCCLLLCSV